MIMMMMTMTLTTTMTMTMTMMMIIHNDMKKCYDGKMICHKTKNATEKIHGMKSINMMMMMVMMIMMMMMAMMTMKNTKTTMEIELCVRMDDWRSHLDLKVNELQRSS